jgi:hypothetical protein
LAILVAEEKPGAWEEEKRREGAVEEKGFLCAAVVGLGFCWKADVTATERPRLERRGLRKGRRKVEENSLMMVVLTRGVEDRRERVAFIIAVVQSVRTVFFRRGRVWLFYFSCVR